MFKVRHERGAYFHEQSFKLAIRRAGNEGLIERIDHLLVVPSASVHRIQEAQTTLYQVLWELTQASLATGGLPHE